MGRPGKGAELSALGPFSRPQGVFLRRESRPDFGAVVAHPQDGVVLDLFRGLRVLSSAQVAELSGLSHRAARSSVSRLFALGYLDRLCAGSAPPLYVLGKAGSSLFRVWPEEWDAPSAFRLAAANQLFLSLRRAWGDFEWRTRPGLGAEAGFARAGKEYLVFAPRCGEGRRFAPFLRAVPAGTRVLVVAGDRETALSAASSASSGSLRFTWDALLKNGAPVFYRWDGRRLEEAERLGDAGKIFAGALDSASGAW